MKSPQIAQSLSGRPTSRPRTKINRPESTRERGGPPHSYAADWVERYGQRARLQSCSRDQWAAVGSATCRRSGGRNHPQVRPDPVPRLARPGSLGVGSPPFHVPDRVVRKVRRRPGWPVMLSGERRLGRGRPGPGRSPWYVGARAANRRRCPPHGRAASPPACRFARRTGRCRSPGRSGKRGIVHSERCHRSGLGVGQGDD
jgi:hypothetical protein